MPRAIGCVLGAFVGDAAGAVLEFMKKEDISPEKVDNALKMNGGGYM
jgi:ADP-ribosyl-[dinitrogen reductase] hydrolase